MVMENGVPVMLIGMFTAMIGAALVTTHYCHRSRGKRTEGAAGSTHRAPSRAGATADSTQSNHMDTSAQLQVEAYLQRLLKHRVSSSVDIGGIVTKKDRRGLVVGSAGAVVCVPTWDQLLLMRHGERLDHAFPGWLAASATPLTGTGARALPTGYYKDAGFAPTDPPLSPTGWSQALETGRYLSKLRAHGKGVHIAALDEIHTSPFQRCVETALMTWMVGYQCRVPLCVNPVGLSEFLSAKVTKQMRTPAALLNGQWVVETSDEGRRCVTGYALPIHTFLQPVGLWIRAVLSKTAGGDGWAEDLVGMADAIFNGGGGSESVVGLLALHLRSVRGVRCLFLPVRGPRPLTVIDEGESLLDMLDVNISAPESRQHLHARVASAAFSFCDRRSELNRSGLADIVSHATVGGGGVSHHLCVSECQNPAHPPPTSVLAVTHADVVAAALSVMCENGADPAKLASGVSVAYASWTLLTRRVTYVNLVETAAAAGTSAALHREQERAPPPAHRGKWTLGLHDGAPVCTKAAGSAIQLPPKCYPRALPDPLPMGLAALCSGFGVTEHISTIVRVVVGAR